MRYKSLKLIDAGPMLDAYFNDLFDKTNKRIMSAARHGVSEAINRIKEKTKQNIASSWFNGTTSAGRTLRGKTYTTPLIEGVRAFMYRGAATGFVNVLGNKWDDGTWRLRFFEGGTKVRNVKKVRKTKPRKSEKSSGTYGSIRPSYFFSNAYASIGSDAIVEIQNSIQSAIDEINNLNI